MLPDDFQNYISRSVSEVIESILFMVLIFKHPALPAEVTLSLSYPR
jgi:hypothetical protein